jgi:Na+-translocating ferredoxin:NAD+ oxidoreductase RnfG subunit
MKKAIDIALPRLNKIVDNVSNVNKEIIEINDNDTNANNVINVIPSKYALNKSKFVPNTDESCLAEEMAEYFNDLKNYAFYFHVTKKLGYSGAYAFFDSVKADIKEKMNTAHPVRSPKKYFAWRYKRGMY